MARKATGIVRWITPGQPSFEMNSTSGEVTVVLRTVKGVPGGKTEVCIHVNGVTRVRVHAVEVALKDERAPDVGEDG